MARIKSLAQKKKKKVQLYAFESSDFWLLVGKSSIRNRLKACTCLAVEYSLSGLGKQKLLGSIKL